jgi:hypothetical protein
MKYPTLSPYGFTANNPIFFVDIDGNKFVTFSRADRKQLKRFKRELKLTHAGRAMLISLDKSPHDVLVRFTPAIMQPLDESGNALGGVTEGLTFPARVNKENGGLSFPTEGTTANPDTEADVTVLKISDGTHDYRNYYRTMTGKELSDADPTSESDVSEKNRLMQEFTSCAGATVEDQYGNQLSSDMIATQQTVTEQDMLFPFGGNKKMRESSNALNDETQSEHSGRVGVHEGEHVLTFDKLNLMRDENGNPQQGKRVAFRQLESNRELPSYKKQAKVVEQQKVQRTQN